MRMAAENKNENGFFIIFLNNLIALLFIEKNAKKR